MVLSGLVPRADLLAAAIALDLLLGDPVYPWHPIRLVGRSLRWTEAHLRAWGADGYLGGCALFVVLAVVWGGGTTALLWGAGRLHPAAGTALHLFLLYSLLALRDLLKHVGAIDAAAEAGDLAAARRAAGRLVGRDTDRMDAAACRRSGMESLAENLVDAFVTPIFWYCLAGMPGIVVFKVVSTMDSVVGYKTERYLRFGWCGARLDDLMNLLPARLTWLLIAGAAALTPGGSARGALAMGWRHHAVVPGPNAGWSEAALAGAIRRRLAGPIWLDGRQVTDLWIGDPAAPAAATTADCRRARHAVLVTAAFVAGAAIVALAAGDGHAPSVWTAYGNNA